MPYRTGKLAFLIGAAVAVAEVVAGASGRVKAVQTAYSRHVI